jgi:hypothetical protein
MPLLNIRNTVYRQKVDNAKLLENLKNVELQVYASTTLYSPMGKDTPLIK